MYFQENHRISFLISSVLVLTHILRGEIITHRLISQLHRNNERRFQNERLFLVNTILRVAFRCSECLSFGQYFLIGICQSETNATNDSQQNVFNWLLFYHEIGINLRRDINIVEKILFVAEINCIPQPNFVSLGYITYPRKKKRC